MPTVSEPARAVVSLYLLTWWVLGVAVADGFWQTLFALFVPPYAFVLFTELVLIRMMGG